MKWLPMIVSCTLLLGACAKYMSIEDYSEYTEGHSDLFRLENGIYPKLSLSIVTPEMVVVENSAEMETAELQQEYELMRKQNLTLFKLKITTEQSFINSSKGNKAEQTEYYSVHFRKTIQAITVANDTLECSGYLFQAGSGMGNNGYFEFQFSKTIKDLKEILISSPYLGDSIYKFNLDKFHTNYPSLKIN